MLLWGMMLFFICSATVLMTTDMQLLSESAGPYWQYVTQAVATLIMVIVLSAALYHKGHSKRIRKEKDDFTWRSLLIRYQSLKQQVDPHTLFNTMNSISALIPMDPVRAEKCVESMSLVYRYLLQDHSNNLVPFHREVVFIRSYLYLLQVRLGGALQISLHMSEGAQLRGVPPFTLKLIVDDAITSNEFSMQNPMHICITTPEDDRVVVRISARGQKTSGKTGLANVLECYRILHHPFVEIRVEEGEFTVVLPLIKNATP